MVLEKLKTRLIDRINKIDDQNVIEDIYRLLEIDLEDTIYITNQAQKVSINEALEQYKSGEVISNDDVSNETDQWLKKTNSLDSKS